MERLWAPWRMTYLEHSAPPGCFFCAAAASGDDRVHLTIARDPAAVVMLNKYPYGHGHLLVAPVRHVARLGDLADVEYDGLMRAVRRTAAALESAFHPEGMNVGMNLGRAAGAGVADHCHWHVLPRWNGDTNFMPVIGDVKVMSEHLEATFDRLQPLFR
jgi:ATP adenylyltransferase